MATISADTEEITRDELVTKQVEIPLNSDMAAERSSLLAFVGPKTIEQTRRLDELLSGKAEPQQATSVSRAVDWTKVSTDELLSVAKRQAEQHDVVRDTGDRTDFYSEIEKQTLQLKQDRSAATTKAEQAEVAQKEQSFKNLTLLLAKDLQADLKSSDNGIAQAAQKVRDQLVAISDPQDLVFAGFNVDNEIERKVGNNGSEKALSFVETGRYAFDDKLEIDLGEYQAMVQVARSGNSRLAPLTSVSESPAVEDGSIDETNDTTNGGTATSLHVDGTANAQQETVIRFSLDDFGNPTTIADAQLQLSEIGTGAGDAEVYVWNGLYDGQAWDETNVHWEHIDQNLGYSQRLSEFTQVGDWAAGSTTEVDVSAHVQRALLYGDANGDGAFAGAGYDGDIEAFHLAVTNWDAYVAEYGPRANSASDLIARTDGGLGDGTVDTDDVADFFRRHGYSQGDYNLDGTVQDNADSGIDGLDWAIFNANYGLENARFTQGDGNFDGIVDDDDYDIWFDRKNEDNLTPEAPELIVWVRPEDSTTDIEFASQEHAMLDGPTLVVNEQPDLAVNTFSVDGSNLVVDYAIFGETFTDVKVQLYKAGSPDALLHETAVQSGALGSHEVLIATSVLSSIVEGDSIYAKVVGTPSSGTQANTTNDQLDFEFSTDSSQTVNSLDDAGMDTLLRDKHTLRELLAANESLGWFDTIAFDDYSLFGSEQETITLGDHTGDGVADQLDIDQDITINGPGADRLTIDGRGQTRGIYIDVGSVVTLSGFGITDGYTISHGAGIYNRGDLTIDRMAIRDSNSQSHGGGIYNHIEGTLDITSSTIDSNAAYHGGGISGFFDVGQTLSIDKSTISNNSSTSHSGGLSIVGTAGATETEVLIVNSTFSGNTSGTVGGAIRTQTNTHLKFVNTTVTDNTASSSAGGIWAYPGLTNTVHNSIIADNHLTGSSVWATDVSGNYAGAAGEPSTGNLIGIAHSGLYFDGSINQLGTTSAPLDPMLAELETYGLHTAAHVPLPGSPAIDSGNDALVIAYGTELTQSGLIQWADIPNVGVPGVYSDVGSASAYAGYMTEQVLIASISVAAVTAAMATPTEVLVNIVEDELDEDLRTEEYVTGDPDISLREALEIAKQLSVETIVFDDAVFGSQQTILLGDSDGNGVVEFEQREVTTPLEVPSGVSVQGKGSELLTIDADGASRVVHVMNRYEAMIGQDVTLSGLTITGGANAAGAGLLAEHGGKLTLVDAVVTGNVDGGGIHARYSELEINDSEVVDNSSSWNGGGIHLYKSSLSLTDSTVSGNMADRAGGGIHAWNDSHLESITIQRSTIAGNHAYGASQSGGGLNITSYSGRVEIDSSTISGNSAAGDGGGIYVNKLYSVTFPPIMEVEDSGLWISNSTISSNTASDDGGGLAARYSLAHLTNVTVANNHADSGGGIWEAGSGEFGEGELKLYNTIVADNYQFNTSIHNDLVDLGDTVDPSSDYNLFGPGIDANATASLNTANNILLSPNDETGLAPLGNYGGPTKTHALLPGSVAIDAAPNANGTDQRGFLRGFDVAAVDNGPGLADIGAYEYQSNFTVFGTELADQISITETGWTITTGGSTDSFDFDWSTVDSIRVEALGDSDSVEVSPLVSIGQIAIFGGPGHDLLQGGSGSDVIYGGLGNDYILNSDGSDVLDGGEGNDQYLYSGIATSVDSIVDEAGFDTLDFSAFVGGGVEIDLHSAELVKGIEPSQLLVILAAGEIEEVIGTPERDIIKNVSFGSQVSDSPGFDFPEIKDNSFGQTVYSEDSGLWTDDSLSKGYLASQRVGTPEPGANAEATWLFENVPVGEYYPIATWQHDTDNAASDINVSISGGVVSLSSTTVDQTAPPQGVSYAERPWQVLGSVAVSSLGSVSVAIGADSGLLLADAVMLVPEALLPAFIGVSPEPSLQGPYTDADSIEFEVSAEVLGGTSDDLQNLIFAAGDAASTGVVIRPKPGTPGTVTVSWDPLDVAGHGTLHIPIEVRNTAAPEFTATTSITLVVDALNERPEIATILPFRRKLIDAINFNTEETRDFAFVDAGWHEIGGYTSGTTNVVGGNELELTGTNWQLLDLDGLEFGYDSVIDFELEVSGNPELIGIGLLSDTLLRDEGLRPIEYDGEGQTHVFGEGLEPLVEDGNAFVQLGGSAVDLDVIQNFNTYESEQGRIHIRLPIGELTYSSQDKLVFAVSDTAGTAVTRFANVRVFNADDLAVKFDVDATDPDDFDFHLRYSLDSSAPEGASVDDKTGRFYWVPQPNQVGEHDITIIATDQGNLSLSGARTFNVSVLPSGVVQTHGTVLQVDEGGTLTIPSISVPHTLADGSDLEVTMSGINGTVALADSSSLPTSVTVRHGTGDGERLFILRGSEADLNTALVGLTFQPLEYYQGPASVRIRSVAIEANGDYRSDSATHTIPVAVNPITTQTSQPLLLDPLAPLATNEDTLLLGIDLKQGNTDLTVISIDDKPVYFGEKIVLPSGATVTVLANGLFDYDPTTSTEIDDISQFTYTDYFTYEVASEPDEFDAVATDYAVVEIDVARVDDPHVVIPAVYSIDSTVENGDVVGEIVLANPDMFSYIDLDSRREIISGNESGAFRIEHQSGNPGLAEPSNPSHVPSSLTFQLVVNDAIAVVNDTDQVFELEVRIRDNNSVSSTGTYTVLVDSPNADPIAEADAYSVAADGIVLGNLITNNTGHGVDKDPDGISSNLTLFSIDGRPIDPVSANAMGTIVLASGAVLTFSSNGDGDFSYNASHSLEYRSLAEGETALEIIPYEISDGAGGYDWGEMQIVIEGVNDFPTANDISYIVSATEIYTGNLVNDYDHNGPDFDPDENDALGVLEINGQLIDGIAIIYDTPFDLPSGAKLTVQHDGTFLYNPTTLANYATLLDATLLDEFEYTVTDGRPGSTSTATVSITVLPIELAARAKISDFSLVADDGFYDFDDASSDSRLRGVIKGNFSGVDKIVVEFDHYDGDGVHSADGTVEILNPDGELTFQYDGLVDAPNPYANDVAQNPDGDDHIWKIAYRTVAYDANDDVMDITIPVTGEVVALGTGPWNYFEFEETDRGPARFEVIEPQSNFANDDGIRLVQDTGTFSFESTDDDFEIDQDSQKFDNKTSNPSITGTVHGDLSTDPIDVVLVVEAGYTDINSGLQTTVSFSETVTIPAGSTLGDRAFVYDPSTHATFPSFDDVDDFGGYQDRQIDVAITYHLVQASQSTDSKVLEYDYLEPGKPIGTLDDLELKNVTGMNGLTQHTSDPTIVGEIENSPVTVGGISAAYIIEFDIEDGTRVFDATDDGTGVDGIVRLAEAGSFEFIPPGLTPGPGNEVKIRARLKESYLDSGVLVGDWVDMYDPNQNAHEISFFYETDTPASIEYVGLANPTGDQSATPISSYDATITGYLAGVEDSLTEEEATEGPGLPIDPIEGFNNAEGSETDLVGGLDISPEDLIRDSLNTDFAYIEIEVYHTANQPVETDIPTWVISTDAEGYFEFLPRGLVAGETEEFWLRTRRVDPLLSNLHPATLQVEYVFGEWFDSKDYLSTVYPFSFEYENPPVPTVTVLEPNSSSGGAIPETTSTLHVGLLEAGIVDYNDVIVELFHTDAANLSGLVPDGYAFPDENGYFEYVYVGLSASTTPYSLHARATIWDVNTGAYLAGTATTSQFILNAPYNSPITVASFNLDPAVISGNTGTQPVTSNPTLLGTLENLDGDVAGAKVEFYEGQTLVGTTYADADGAFRHSLSGLSVGLVSLTAVAYEFDELSAFVPGTPSTEAEFVFELAGSTSVTFDSLTLLSDSGSSHSDLDTANPTLTGTIGGDGSLLNTTILFDHDDDGSTEGLAFVDANGTFTYAPVGLGYAADSVTNDNTTIRGTIRRWNPVSLGYESGESLTIDFDYLDPAVAANSHVVNVGGRLLELELANDTGTTPSVTTDPTINGRVSNDGSLNNILIEFDYDNDQIADQTTTTDDLGRFAFTPTLLPTGSATIAVRTREWNDVAKLYETSQWTGQSGSPHVPGSLSFTYEASEFSLPTVDTMSLANGVPGSPPVTADPSLSLTFGGLSQYQTAEVEFSLAQDGSVIHVADITGVTSLDFDPRSADTSIQLVDGGQYTIWARVKGTTGNAATPYLYSDSQSSTFVFDAAPNDIKILELALTNDTGSSDGATTDASITGLLGGPETADLSSASIQIDYDGDEIEDATVTTVASSGNFTLMPPAPLDGYNTIWAKISNVSGSQTFVSGWRAVNFVYDSVSAGSEAAQALVSAFELVDPLWQSAQTPFDYQFAQGNSELLYQLSEDSTASEADFLAVKAELDRQAAELAAEQNYSTELASAESNYQIDLAAARTTFENELSQLSATDQAAFSLDDFVWPETPADIALIVPSDSSQPESPASLPDYTGPSPVIDTEAYRNLVAIAEDQYNKDLRDARQDQRTEDRAAKDAYEAAAQQLGSKYSQDIEAANQLFFEQYFLNDQDPDAADFDVQRFFDLLLERYDAWLDFWQNRSDITHVIADLVAKGSEKRNELRAEIEADWVDVSNALPPDASDVEWYNAYKPFPIRYSNEQIPFDLRNNYLEFKQNTAVAGILRTARKRDYEATSELVKMLIQYDHDDLIDRLGDWQQLLTAPGGLASLREQFEVDIAAEQRLLVENLALNQRIFDEAIADAEHARTTELAEARDAAVNTWADALGFDSQMLPWAEYQRELSTNERIYTSRVADHSKAHAYELAAADYEEAETIAMAGKFRTTQFMTASTAKSNSVFDAYVDFRVESSKEYTERDKAVTDLWEERWDKDADLQHEKNTARFEELRNYKDNQDKTQRQFEKIEPRENSSYIQDWEGWARDAYDDDGNVVIDNTSIRIQARIAKDQRVFRDSLRNDINTENIFLKFRQADARATSAQLLEINSLEETAVRNVVDLYFEYETKVADALSSYATDYASSVRDYDTLVANANRDWLVDEAMAGRDFAKLESDEAATLAIENADAKRDYEIEETDENYSAIISNIGNWPAGTSSVWAGYQVDLAQAELDRVTSLADAEAERTEELANSKSSWLHHIADADHDLAVDTADANLDRRIRINVATYDTAHQSSAYGNKNSAGQYRDKAYAISRHDDLAAAAGKRLEDTQVHQDLKQILNHKKALRDRAVAKARATFARQMVRIDIQHDHGDDLSYHERSDGNVNKLIDRQAKADARYSKAIKAANRTFNRSIAAVGLQTSKRKIDQRENWANRTNQLHFELISDIIDGELEQRESLGQAMSEQAAKVAFANEQYAKDIADAQYSHTLEVVIADARYATQQTDAEATYATEQTKANSTFSEDSVAALGTYETTLYANHSDSVAAAANVILASAASPVEKAITRYHRDTSSADATWIASKAVIRNGYHEDLSEAQLARTSELNYASRLHTQQANSIDHKYWSDQAELDRNFAYDLAEAEAVLYEATQHAEADRIIESAGLAPTIDRLTAEKTAQYYDDRVQLWRRWANVAARIISQRRANIGESGTIYQDRAWRAIVRAYDSLNRNLIKANSNLQNDIRYPYAELNKELHGAGIEYAIALADAREQHTMASADAQQAYVARSSDAEIRWTAASSRNDAKLDLRLAQADHTLTELAGQAETAYHADLVAVQETQSSDKATAEAAYHFEIAVDERDRLVALANTSSNPEVDFLAYQAGARLTWMNALSEDYVDYRSGLATAEAQYQTDIAAAQAQQNLAESETNVDYVRDLVAPTVERATDIARTESYYASLISAAETQLAVDLATADSQHAFEYAVANYEYGFDYDTAWEPETNLKDELLDLIAYAVELNDSFNSNPQYNYGNEGVPGNVIDRIYYLYGYIVSGQIIVDREFAIKAASAQRDKALAIADYDWTEAAAEADAVFTEAEAYADRWRTGELTAAEQAFALDETAAQADYDLAFAEADGQFGIDQTAAENAEREAGAAAQADFLTAHYGAKVNGMHTLDVSLNSPWSHSQHELAIAEASAWTGLKAEYLDWQADISLARSLFQQTRGIALVGATEAVNTAALDFAQTNAAEIIKKANDSAQSQFEYTTDLAEVTRDYRVAMADADREDRIATADETVFNRIAAESEAKAEYDDRYAEIGKDRRIELANAHETFTSKVGGKYLATSSTIAAAEYDFADTLATQLQLTELLVATENKLYDADEATAFHNTLVSLATTAEGQDYEAWVDWQLDEALARKDKLVDGLADDTVNYRMALVASDNAYDQAQATLDQFRTNSQARLDVASDQWNAGALLSSAQQSDGPDVSAYPDSSQAIAPPEWPVLDLYASLDVFNYDDDYQEIDVLEVSDIYFGTIVVSERVGPRFAQNYNYAYAWLPGHIDIRPVNGFGDLAYYEAFEALAGEAGSAGPVYGDRYALYPWGPGHLDHFTQVRIHTPFPYHDFVPMIKTPFANWMSPWLGSATWESTTGYGYTYTYVPAKFMEAVRENYEDPAQYLLGHDYGSYYDTLQPRDNDDSVEKETSKTDPGYASYVNDPNGAWKEQLFTRHYKFEEEYGARFVGSFDAFTFLAHVAYGSAPYNSFNADTTAERAQRIVDTTIRATHLGQLEGTQYFSVPDDITSVQIETTTGDVTLVGDDFTPNQVAAVGDGDLLEQTNLSTTRSDSFEIVERWTPRGVETVMRNFSELEDEFLKNVGVRLRQTTATRTLWGLGWVTDEPSFGLKYIPSARSDATAGFVDTRLFKKITGRGLNGGHGYQQVLTNGFRLEFEVPRNWTNFQVAEYLVSVLHGQAPDGLKGLGSDSIETLFDNFLKDKLSRDELSVDEALTSYKQSVANGLSELLDDIQAWTETGVSFIPGASGPTAVYEWQQGRKLSALITLLTMGTVGGVLARQAGGLSVKVADKVLDVIPQETLDKLSQMSAAKFRQLTKAMDAASGSVDEQLEALRRFLAKNKRTLGPAGSLDRIESTDTLWSIVRAADSTVQRRGQYHVHHLITVAEANESTALKAAADVGYDINNAKNLMPLPSDEQLALADLLPLHRGPHPTQGEASEYMVFLASELDRLDLDWNDGNGRLSYNQLFDRIELLSNRLRTGLENLEWRLSRSDPHPR